MKMPLLLVSALWATIAASPAFAAKWEPHGTTREGSKCFYNPQSIVSDKGTVRVWERTVGTKADMEKGISEARTLTEFDCDGQKYKAIISVTYPADKTQPLIVKNDETDWNAIAPDTATEALCRKVCTRQQQQATVQEPVPASGSAKK